MVKFIIGSSGSGKSEHIYSSIVDDINNSKKVILIVPEQEVLRCERILAERLDGVNSLMLEVVSFRRLCNRIFREYGGLCKNYITGAGRAMLMWRALSEFAGNLSYFSNSDVSDGALLDKLLSFVGQMKAYKISPVKFADCISSLKGDLLKAKMEDLASLYLRYDALLHESFDDTAEDLSMAHLLLCENDFFSGYSVYVDSYYGFTPAEIDILEDIFKSDALVTVSLLCNPDDDGDYERLVNTKNKLISLAKESSTNGYETVYLKDMPRFNVPELSYLSANIWNHTAEAITFANPDSVVVAECPDPYTEAEWIAADIRRNVRNGLKYSDIAIIARDPSALNGMLDVALEAQKIPYHMSNREDITVYPIVRYLLFALKIIEGGWKRTDIISYIKTGILSLEPREIDIIENYASFWNINGFSLWNTVWNMNPSGFRESRSEEDVILLDNINTIREKIVAPLYDLSQSLSDKFTARSGARAIYDFLIKSGADSSVENSDDGVVWNALIGAVDVLYTCGGEEKLNTKTLLSLLKNIFDHTDIGSIPSFSDEVSITGAALSRTGTVKRIYICSANDGVFPATVKDDVLFSNADLLQLRSAGIDLEDNRETRSNDELLYFARALSCASDSLCITYYSSDMQGKKALPSHAVKRVMSLLSGIKITYVKDMDPLELTEDVDAAFRSVGEYWSTPFGKALLGYFRDDENYKGVVMNGESSLIMGEYKFAHDVSLRIFGSEIALTQSRIESFNSCPFKFACTYIFKIPDIRSDRYNSADIGTFIHSILEKYFKDSSDFTAASETEIEARVDSIINDYVEASLGSDDMMNSRTKALFRRLRRTALTLVSDITKEFSNSDFKPTFFELGIGSGEEYAVNPIKVSLSDSSNAFVYGFIDRVDTCDINGNTYVRIVDYKTGDHTLKADDAEKGNNLQMLLYLFSVCSDKNNKLKKELDCNGKIIPAGVEYFMAHAPRTIIRTEDDIDKLYGNEVVAKRRGFVLNDDSVLEALDSSGDKKWLPLVGDGAKRQIGLLDSDGFNKLENTVRSSLLRIGDLMKSGECSVNNKSINANDSPCKYCAYRPICRREDD